MGNLLFYVNPPPQLPLDAMFYYEHFVGLSYFATQTPGNSQIYIDVTGLHITTDETSEDETQLYRNPPNFYYDPDWSKRREIKFTLQLQLQDSAYGRFFYGTGQPNTNRHIGIKLQDGTIYATTANGTQEDTATLIELTPGPIHEQHKFWIKFFPMSHAEFWVDGIMMASLDDALPEGDNDAEVLINITAASTFIDPDYYTVSLTTNYFELYQEKA